MTYSEILTTIIGLYTIGIFICLMLSIDLEDSNWKFAKIQYIILYPIIPFILFIDLIKFVNKYLNKNNLKQMNFKILGKAMGFMFLPTLGVLLMLLIGFFDPIDMWNWIKSDSGWAIFTRIIIFILETGLVIHLYFDYLKKEIKEKALNGVKPGIKQNVYYNKALYQIWPDGKDNGYYNFYIIHTEDPDIIIVERTKK